MIRPVALVCLFCRRGQARMVESRQPHPVSVARLSAWNEEGASCWINLCKFRRLRRNRGTAQRCGNGLWFSAANAAVGMKQRVGRARGEAPALVILGSIEGGTA